MVECGCSRRHEPVRVVLTGGPGAGKTAVLELVRQHFCRHVEVLNEAASILFSGGFQRGKTDAARAAAQRAIFHVQREQEEVAAAENGAAIVLCDRGTVDGLAYWPGPGDFYAAMGTTRAREFERYHAVLHLRTPPLTGGYNHSNPVRIETAAEAARIDTLIEQAWEGHPRRNLVDSRASFLDKAAEAVELLRAVMPDCCRAHLGPAQAPGRAR
jgi:predicted ATPase